MPISESGSRQGKQNKTKQRLDYKNSTYGMIPWKHLYQVTYVHNIYAKNFVVKIIKTYNFQITVTDHSREHNKK